MARWELRFRVNMNNLQSSNFDKDTARGILRSVLKLDPRPISAEYDGSEVKMVFMVDVESQTEAHGQQGRILDSLYKAVNEVRDQNNEQLVFGIEFDAPRGVEAGANPP